MAKIREASQWTIFISLPYFWLPKILPTAIFASLKFREAKIWERETKVAVQKSNAQWLNPMQKLILSYKYFFKQLYQV